METVERSQVRIDAPGVPPRVIAELLLSTGAGRLHDYDEASLFEGWHESLLLEAPWSHPRPAVPGRIVAHARIHYDSDPRP